MEGGDLQFTKNSRKGDGSYPLIPQICFKGKLSSCPHAPCQTEPPRGPPKDTRATIPLGFDKPPSSGVRDSSCRVGQEGFNPPPNPWSRRCRVGNAVGKGLRCFKEAEFGSPHARPFPPLESAGASQLQLPPASIQPLLQPNPRTPPRLWGRSPPGIWEALGGV